MSDVNTHHFPLGDILVVDDNKSDLKFLSSILRKAGYTVRPASDGELALRSVQARLPALILLDVNMPGLDGYEVCRRLKDAKDTRDIPVIFISVRTSPLDKVEAFGVGGVDYISKPFEPDEVLARVATHLALWKARKEVEEKNLQLQQEIAEHKQAEESLRLLSSAVEQSSEGIATTDLEGYLLSVNDAFAAMHGYTPQELVGQHLSVFHTPEQMPSVEPASRQIQETGEFSGELWHVRRDGSVFPTLMHNSLLRDKAGNPIGMIGTLRDITERKRAEEALRESEERYRTLFEGVPVGVYRTAAEGQILDANPALVQMLGYPDRESLLRVNAADLYVNPEDRKREQTLLEREEVVRDFEARLRGHDGTIIWVRDSARAVRDADGRVLYYEGAVEDIAEHKQAEERIEHLNLVLRAIRSVNQLISREKDRDHLLQGACESLIETRSYHNAWIALLDESGGLVTTAEAGLGQDFSALAEQLKRGELTACGRNALAQQDVVVVKDPLSTCGDCPLATKYGDRGAMTVRLEHEGEVYGLLSVSVPRDLATDEEERVLLQEVAGDIAFALYSIELEEGRKRAEGELRDAYKQLLDTIDFLPDATFVIDVDKKVIAWNHAMEEMTGVHKEEIMGKGDYAYTLPFYGIRRPMLIDLVLASDKEIEARYDYIERKGNTLIAEAFLPLVYEGKGGHFWGTAAPLFDSEGNIVGAIESIRDITERKRAEEALRVSEERFALAVQGSNDGIWDWDIQNNSLYWSPRLKAFLGYADDELEIDFETLESLLHPDDREHTGAAIEAHLKDRGLYDMEQRLCTKSGQYRWFRARGQALWDEAGNPVRMVGSTTDITERKRMEEALRESEEKFRTFVETASDLMHIADKVGNITDVNEAMCETLGYSREEMIGMHISQVISEESMQDFEPEWKELVAKGRFAYEPTWITKDGKEVCGEIKVVAIYDSDGKYVGSRGIFHDITERRRAEEELQRLYEQAQRDAEAKATLLREVNHRVKNNLSAIVGLLYVERNHAEAADQPVYRAITQSLINRVGGLSTVHSLLSASEWAPLLLSDLIGQVIRSSLQVLPRAKSIPVEVTPSPVRVTPDQAHNLALVINELATNTIKHALQERDTAHITVRIALEDDDTVQFEFRDDGPGYPEDVLQLERYSVGFELIQNIVRQGLRGELSLRTDGGAVAVIRFKRDPKGFENP